MILHVVHLSLVLCAISVHSLRLVQITPYPLGYTPVHSLSKLQHSLLNETKQQSKMARLSISMLALCLFLAVFATALPAAQNNRPDPDAWTFHVRPPPLIPYVYPLPTNDPQMAEEMADSASPTPAHGSTTPSHAHVHAPASSATPSNASPLASTTPSSSASPGPPEETISGGKSKSAFDSIPLFGPLLGSLLGS